MSAGLRGKIFVDGGFDQEGTEHVHAGLEDDGGHGERNLRPVRAQILHRRPHQPAVVRFS